MTQKLYDPSDPSTFPASPLPTTVMTASSTNVQFIHIDDKSLHAWRQNDLETAVAILSRQVLPHGDHHRLANLAILRGRQKEWKLAEQDARMSIQIQPTIAAHIAMSMALGGKHQLARAKQQFNRIFLLDEVRNETLLLLIKCIIISVAGNRDEAVRRVSDLSKACAEADKGLCRTIQAQMQFLLGETFLHERDYEKALQSFTSARVLAPFPMVPELDTISLMFGWDLNSLLFSIYQQTCEAQYAMSQLSETVESLRIMLDEFGAELKSDIGLSNWLDNFTHKCVQALTSTGDEAAAAGNHEEAFTHYSSALSLDSLVSRPEDSYTCKAKALYAYTASPDDPNELSFVKGEILDILDKQGKWWQAKQTDGTVGIVPSVYMQVIPADAKAAAPGDHEETAHYSSALSLDSQSRLDLMEKRDKARSAASGGRDTSPSFDSRSGLGDADTANSTSDKMPEAAQDQEYYAYRAKALYAYSASPDDPNELSFVKGKILDILDVSGKWWQAEKTDGTVGIVPSNYMQII